MVHDNPLEFRAIRAITDLNKQCLILMEDLFLESERARDALEETISKFDLESEDKDLLIAIINQGFAMNPNKKMGIRKRLLDVSNDAIRSLSWEFGNWDIQIKRDNQK